jgi:hypothetical protein
LISHSNSPAKYEDYLKPANKNAFQAINAKMVIIGDATTQNFMNGSFKSSFQDPPTKGALVLGTALENPSDGYVSIAPSYSNLLPKSGACAGDEINWVQGSKAWNHFTRNCWPGDDYIIKLSCSPKSSN